MRHDAVLGIEVELLLAAARRLVDSTLHGAGKTFSEISQLSVIQQAAQRQKYIDQGQSVNIMVHPATSAKDLNQLYLTAEELGLKSIYYQYNISAAQVFNRNLLNCNS